MNLRDDLGIPRLTAAAKAYAEDPINMTRFDELMDAALTAAKRSDMDWAGELSAAEEECERLREACQKARELLDHPSGASHAEVARRNTEAWKVLFLVLERAPIPETAPKGEDDE